MDSLLTRSSSSQPSKHLVVRTFRSPWMVIAVGVWVQSLTGGSYDFSIYSQSIKDSLGLTQQALNSVSVAKDIGANVGIISGLLYDALPTWTVLSSAAALYLVGNLFMWLSITSRVSEPPLWLVCIYAFLAANAQTFSNTAVVVTCVKIFPNSRGTVVGLMKGCLGIGGAILVQLYTAAFGSNAEAFVLMMACLAPVVCLVANFFIRPLPPTVRADEKKWLNVCSVISLTLAAYLLTVIILNVLITFSRAWRIVIFCGIVVILLSPVWVAVKSELDLDKHSFLGKEETDYLLITEEKVSRDSEVALAPDSPAASINSEKDATQKRGDDTSLWQALHALDFWLLFVGCACGMGSGLTVINNMSQLGVSLGYSSNEISTFVSLWSIWNFLGRFGSGYISEYYYQSKGVSRPLFIAITLAAMAVGHVMIAIAFPTALYIGPLLVGTCYGAQWGLMPTIASEIFGLKSFGAIFNTIAVASPVGSFILSQEVTGYLYDVEAEKGGLAYWLSHGLPSSSSSCNGAHCFRLSFLIMAAVCASGSCASVILTFRTRQFYRSLQQMRD